MPIDYRGLPVNPHELYQRFQNGLPPDFSFRDLMAANPTQYDAGSYGENNEERIRQWIAAGRPGWDSQGRVLGTHGQLLDDYSAAVATSDKIPARLSGPQPTSFNPGGNPLARPMQQRLPGNAVPAPLQYQYPNNTFGSQVPTVGTSGTGAAPQRDIYANPAAAGTPIYGSPRNQQQTPVAGNPAAGTIPTLYNQAQGSAYQQSPQPDLNLLARQGMGNRPGMRSPFAKSSHHGGTIGNRSPRGYQGY